MNKSSIKNLFHRVLMMAWTIIVTLPYATPAFAGPIKWLKRGVERVSQTAKEVTELGKDSVLFALEKGRITRHVDQFWAQTSLQDLYGGRSMAQFCVLIGLFAGSSYILVKIRGNKTSKYSYLSWILLFYAMGVAAGWGFELAYTYAEYRPFAANIQPFFAYYTLGLLAIGLVVHFDKLPTLRKALAARRQWLYFRKTWELAPEGAVLPDATEVPAPTDEAAPQQAPATPAPTAEAVPAPATAVAPASAPSPTPPAPLVIISAPKPDKPYFRDCPSCHKRIPANAMGCGFCGTVFKKAPQSTVACAACGKQIPTNAKGCGFCGARAILVRSDGSEPEDQSLDWTDLALRK